MNAHTEPQIIHHDGKPMYAAIPYNEYTALLRKAEEMEGCRPAEQVEDQFLGRFNRNVVSFKSIEPF